MLELKLPFAPKEKLELYHGGDELVVVVGNYKRQIALPTTLMGREISFSKMSEGTLKVYFDR
ncbi:MAG: ArsA family ATPase [Methermicoccaceae archaeon]